MKQLFYPKELSWLDFNARVLQEAKDKSCPLIERVRFLGIFSSNQDEFFRVKFANLKRHTLLQKALLNTSEHERSNDLINVIQQRVLQFNNEFTKIYQQLEVELEQHNIKFVNDRELNCEQKIWLENYFTEKVLRYIQPIIISKLIEFTQCIEDHITYLFVEMHHQGSIQYAVIEVPTADSNRFVLLPRESKDDIQHIILLDDVICFSLETIFKGFFSFDSISAYSFKITRDADYFLSDEDLDDSLLLKMSKSLKQRIHSDPVRVVVDESMPAKMEKKLTKLLGFTQYDTTLPGSRYRNFKDFIGFPKIGSKQLHHPKVKALDNQLFMKHLTVFDAISKQDLLLYYPYHKFHHFKEFIRQASFDPNVTSIKLNIYRIAKRSQIIGSLIDAVRNGKKVVVNVELKARFDETNNIEWAKRMTDAGIVVMFGIRSLKVHSKLCLINRMEQGEIVKYAQIATGNFNEDTAKIYTDYAFFTKNQEIADEVDNVFNFIEYSYKPFQFNHLLISPINQRQRLNALIDNEITNAKAGKPASMQIKVNNLVDKQLIEKLYECSKAGVKVTMLIRGMCSLVAGVKGLSENIVVISIIDRFLEHARVMIFNNNGDNKVYLSSADWMTRNIEDRVEVGVPIYCAELKKQIIDIFSIQLNDSKKARIIDAMHDNRYVTNDENEPYRSQAEIYNYLKELEKSRL